MRKATMIFSEKGVDHVIDHQRLTKLSSMTGPGTQGIVVQQTNSYNCSADGNNSAAELDHCHQLNNHCCLSNTVGALASSKPGRHPGYLNWALEVAAGDHGAGRSLTSFCRRWAYASLHEDHGDSVTIQCHISRGASRGDKGHGGVQGVTVMQRHRRKTSLGKLRPLKLLTRRGDQESTKKDHSWDTFAAAVMALACSYCSNVFGMPSIHKLFSCLRYE